MVLLVNLWSEIKLGCVYEITFPNGKRYVGMTTRKLEDRLKDHFKTSKSSRMNKKKVHHAIAKYGIETSQIDTLFESSDKNKLLSFEVDRIAFLNASKIKLYNLTTGGDGLNGYKLTDADKRKLSESLKGRVFSEEHKRKLSEKAFARPFKKRGPHSEETKRKISESHKGISLSEEVKAKISNTLKEITPWKGKRHSEESIKKMQKAQQELIASCSTKKNKLTKEDVIYIKQQLKNNGKTCSLAKQFNVSPSVICDIKYERHWKWVVI